MPRRKIPSKPKVFDVQVNGLLDISQEINEIFNAGLRDYCTRFGVGIIQAREETKVMVSLIRGGNDLDGLCAYEEETELLQYINAINIQVRCPLMEDWEPTQYVLEQFMEVLCHEFVHAYQCLTGRKGIEITHKEGNVEGEAYYFNAEEIEARVLQAFYANKAHPEATAAIAMKYETISDACGVFSEEL